MSLTILTDERTILTQMSGIIHRAGWGFGAAVLLCALSGLVGATNAAVAPTTATFDTAGNVEGWQSDNTRVTISNPGGWLAIPFRVQYGPCMPENCRIFASTNTSGGMLTGNYVKDGVTQISFNFMASDSSPSALWLSIVSGSGREWYLPLDLPEAGLWTSYTIEIAYREGWFQGPEQSEQMFWSDISDVRRVGVYVRRSARSDAEQYLLDNFSVNNNPGLDSDFDGMSDLSEMSAGTDPYSAESILKITSGADSGDFVVVKWASVSGRTYTLESTTNVYEPFLPLVTGLPATPPENVYTDTTAVGVGPYFYRVGAEP